MVTIFETADINYALQYSRTLKLTLLVLNKADEPVEDAKVPKGISNVAALRKELGAIRDRVIHLLDQLDATQQEHSTAEPPQQPESEKQANITPKQPIPAVHTKEFDPYQQADSNEYKADKVSQAFGLEPSGPAENTPFAPSAAANQPSTQMQPQAHTVPAATTPSSLSQPQAPPTPVQHSIAAQPPIGSPYPPTSYHQQRFPTAQPASSYSLPNQQLQPSYTQGSYNPQPSQQTYPSSYVNQPVPPQQQPAQRMPAPYGAGASQPPQTYSQTSAPQNPPQLGQPVAPGYSYPGYPPASSAPSNPYSRGAQPTYGNRPQQSQY